MSQRIPPMQFTREAFEAEKIRLKTLGHVIDESDADFFSAANGDPTRIRGVWESMRRSPNPKAVAFEKMSEQLGENFSAGVEKFGGLIA